MEHTVVAIHAHPDDVEFLAAGTLAALSRDRGCRVIIATMTAGDCGSISLDDVNKTPGFSSAWFLDGRAPKLTDTEAPTIGHGMSRRDQIES